MVTSYGMAEVLSKMAALMCLMNAVVVLLNIMIVIPRCSDAKMKSCPRQHQRQTAVASVRSFSQTISRSSSRNHLFPPLLFLVYCPPLHTIVQPYVQKYQSFIIYDLHKYWYINPSRSSPAVSLGLLIFKNVLMYRVCILSNCIFYQENIVYILILILLWV